MDNTVSIGSKGMNEIIRKVLEQDRECCRSEWVTRLFYFSG